MGGWLRWAWLCPDRLRLRLATLLEQYLACQRGQLSAEGLSLLRRPSVCQVYRLGLGLLRQELKMGRLPHLLVQELVITLAILQ